MRCSQGGYIMPCVSQAGDSKLNPVGCGGPRGTAGVARVTGVTST